MADHCDNHSSRVYWQ